MKADSSMKTPSKLAIIRSVIDASETSATLYSFTLWRQNQYPDEAHYFCSLKNNHVARKILQESGEDDKIRYLFWHYGVFGYVFGVLRLLQQLEKNGSNVCVHAHHHKLASLLFLALWLRGRRAHTLFTVHSSFDKYAVSQKVWCSIAFVLAGKVVVCGKAAYDAVPVWLRNARKSKVGYIVNGVNIKQIDSCSAGTMRRSRKADEIRMITVGRIIPCKNLAFMLKILKDLKFKWTWTLIGDGQGLGSLRNASRDTGLDTKINYMGLCERGKVFREYGNADVFVSPSLREGMPMAVLEAMASGMPVVLSDISPHRELAQSEGVFVLPLDADQWRQRLAILQQMEPSDFERLGRANRELVISSYSLERMQQEYRKVYEEIWDSNQPSR